MMDLSQHEWDSLRKEYAMAIALGGVEGGAWGDKIVCNLRDRGLTYREIGAIVGRSIERVRQRAITRRHLKEEIR